MSRNGHRAGQRRNAGERHHVAIIGAGVSGICLAILLKKAGLDFTLFEKADDIGGTWRDNFYPGSSCDIVSHLYSYSFELKPDWSCKFAKQDEILDYLDHCVRKYDLSSHLVLGTEIAEARFDEAEGLWHIHTADGAEAIVDVMVSATGQLNRPAFPAIEGLDSFGGMSFHSARWNHDYDLDGKTVAVVGSGASAIQFVPEIAPRVKKLILFQRSANWIVAKPDRPFSEGEKEWFRRWPWLMRLQRLWDYGTIEISFLGFLRDSWYGKLVYERATLKRLAADIADPALRRTLTPDYPAGCKRLLLSNDWFATMARPNVEVVSERVARVTPEGVATVDGRTRAVDAIIYATGFETLNFLAPMKIVGRGGLELDQLWRKGASAHRGLAVAGFPNFFMMYGPNTNLGHGSVVFMIECQAQYIRQCVQALYRRRLRYMDVKGEAMAAFNRKLQREMRKTVWVAGCSSWYKTADGTVTNNWSSHMAKYWWQTRRPKLSEYILV
jgi:cation diffusion facilitator CzcD-associated flavoprotein CzcO